MLACKICLVSLVVTSMLATTKSKNDAENKRNIWADIESSNVKQSSPITSLTNSSKPAIFNMMKGFINTSAKGKKSYYFTAPAGALCADWSFSNIQSVGLCQAVLLATNNNFGGTTRRPDYPNGCYLEKHRPLGFLNTHAGSRTFSGYQFCIIRLVGYRTSIPSTCDCDKPQDINECCCKDRDGDPCCTTECSLPGAGGNEDIRCKSNGFPCETSRDCCSGNCFAIPGISICLPANATRLVSVAAGNV